MGQFPLHPHPTSVHLTPQPALGSWRNILNARQVSPDPFVSHLAQSKSQSLWHGPNQIWPCCCCPPPPTSLAPFHLRWPLSSCSVTPVPMCTRLRDRNRALALMELSFWGGESSTFSDHMHLSATPGSLHVLFLIHGPIFRVSVLNSPLQRPTLPLKEDPPSPALSSRTFSVHVLSLHPLTQKPTTVCGCWALRMWPV